MRGETLPRTQNADLPKEAGALRYGAKRIRTADPLNAIEVLYQLSYSPESLNRSEIYYGFIYFDCQPLWEIFLKREGNLPQLQGI